MNKQEITVGSIVRYKMQRSNNGKVEPFYCRAIVVGERLKGRKDAVIKILEGEDTLHVMKNNLEML